MNTKKRLIFDIFERNSSMAERKIWLNGKIVNFDEATISVLAPTCQFGANVFEGIRGYYQEKNNQVYLFRLKDHHDRLLNSIRLFRIESTYSRTDFESSVFEVIKANELRCDLAVRQTVFVNGNGSWFSKGPVGMFVSPIAKSRKENPIASTEKTLVSSYERISDRTLSPRVKVGANYINSRLAKLEAEDNGYDSALFLNRYGYVAEGTGSCFFMVKKGKLITPLLTDCVLESITRDTLIKLAEEELSIEVVERSIDRSELYSCDEAFFCGSAAEITPIGQLDSFTIGNGKSGEITNILHKAYVDVVSGGNSKFAEWLTPVY